jgi:hypothetical protein
MNVIKKGMKKIKVSFDWDGSLERESVKEYARELIDRDIEVYIVTSRYNNTKALEYYGTSVNDEIFNTAEELGIPIKNIIFTNMEWKYTYFKNNLDYLFHIDDSSQELAFIYRFAKPIAALSCVMDSYRRKGNKLIENVLGNISE